MAGSDVGVTVRSAGNCSGRSDQGGKQTERHYRSERRLGVAARKNRNGEVQPEAIGCILIGDRGLERRSMVVRNMQRTSFCTQKPARFLKAPLLLLAWGFSFCAPMMAQYNLASLGGAVLDPTGAAVPDAKVTIRNTGTGLSRTVTTGENGAFVLPALPVGTYSLTVEKTGFTTHVREGIVLTVDQAASVTVNLQLGQVSDAVTVAPAPSWSALAKPRSGS